MLTRNFSPAVLASVGALFGSAVACGQTGVSATPATPTTAQPDPAMAATSKEIAAVLTAMGHAVVAGDIDAYLKHISPRSPYFLVEQREWAKDLAKADTKPSAFSATIVEASSLETRELAMIGEGGKPGKVETVQAWIGEVRFEYTMPTEGPAKVPSKSVNLSFLVMFLKNHATSAWQYAGEALESLNTTNAIIYYPRGYQAPAKQIAEGFPQAKAHDDEFFGAKIDRVEEIRLFDRRDVLQFSVYPSMFQTDITLSGWSEPGQSIKFLTNYARDVKGWKAAFAHEYGHVDTWELGPKASDMPWWVQEGIAELAAEEFTGGRERMDRVMIRWHKNGELAAWDLISDYRNTPLNKRLHPYHQGQHMVGFISDTFGAEKRKAWLSAMATGTPFAEATPKTLGLTFAELDAKWREHVAGLAAKANAKKDEGKKDEAKGDPTK